MRTPEESSKNLERILKNLSCSNSARKRPVEYTVSCVAARAASRAINSVPASAATLFCTAEHTHSHSHIYTADTSAKHPNYSTISSTESFSSSLNQYNISINLTLSRFHHHATAAVYNFLHLIHFTWKVSTRKRSLIFFL